MLCISTMEGHPHTHMDGRTHTPNTLTRSLIIHTQEATAAAEAATHLRIKLAVTNLQESMTSLLDDRILELEGDLEAAQAGVEEVCMRGSWCGGQGLGC